ncbi:PrgI family protein [Flavobacterium sp. MC2016-06]|jgi:hypothetical protein|uniref:PrgI family protein n=1 Tax=Flavobacterium sp. MC2016-06 TaxID=2676308 RepID=UPI0012BB1654|nr:PrgI family protein [Flavobacterium sp. MC2016-06]MBU3858754.1 PrgI family protein [Flavobacterium sp. MC2016-06]
MENLKFIDPLLVGIKPDTLQEKILNIPVKNLVIAGVGTLLAGAVLKKTGQNRTGSIIGSLALPLLAAACYKKFAK